VAIGKWITEQLNGFAIGDLESMFTNIPRFKLLEWPDESDFVSSTEIVIENAKLSVQDIRSEILSYVEAIGHPISPPLSRAVVTWMERDLALETGDTGLVITQTWMSINLGGGGLLRESYIIPA